jgi:hypothetical protein
MTDLLDPELLSAKHTKEPPRPGIMIATPMYGGLCCGEYVQGILSTMGFMRKLEVPMYWSNLSNESLVTRGRNELVRMFLESPADYLMFIDADIGFDGSAVGTLLAADRDIACGVYTKKTINWPRVKQAALDGVDELKEYGGEFVFNPTGEADAQTDTDGMFEVRHGGTGFMLIKRSVFEALKPHVNTYRTATNKDEKGEYTKPLVHEFFFTEIDDTGALLSEDYAFCALWRRYGGKVYANPFIDLKHVGTYIYHGDILKSAGERL